MMNATHAEPSQRITHPNANALMLVIYLILGVILTRRWLGLALWMAVVAVSAWLIWSMGRSIRRSAVSDQDGRISVGAPTESKASDTGISTPPPPCKMRVETAGVGLDMDEELFTWLGPSWDHTGRDGAVEKHIELLKKEHDPKIKKGILWHIVRGYKNRALAAGDRYSPDDRDALIEIISRQAQNRRLRVHATRLLAEEATRCEKSKDYRTAIAFYRAFLSCNPVDTDHRCMALTGLSFCHNYLREFALAEAAARKAISLQPERYDAWKYLGVSMEHQCQFEQAAECYLKAIRYSGNDYRTVLHFKRLVAEYPSLKQIPNLDIIVKKMGIDLNE
jgi:hypothetical protein